MNIVVVVDRYAPEARSAAHLFEDLAKALVRRGHKVAVITKKPTENLPDGAAFPGVEVRDGVKVVRMRSYMGEPRSTIFKGIDQILLAARVWLRLRFMERPDVVLVYSPPLPLAAACAASGYPLVVNLHDLYPRTAIELGRLRSPLLIAIAEYVEKFIYARTRSFVVPAPESVRYLTDMKQIPADHVRLCYNWVDFRAATPGDGGAFRRMNAAEKKFVVTYAGLVGVAQDLSAMLDAARRSSGDREILFLVIGEGSELDRWKLQAGGLPNLRFLPTLPRGEYHEALLGSDVGLLALSSDLRSPAIPGKLQSIMAAAKPVLAVVPAGSAAARMVEQSACGVVTPPGDGAALLAAVLRLKSDSSLRATLGATGRRFAEKHFALELAVDVFEAALRQAVP